MSEQQQPPSALTAADIAEYLQSADDFAFEREVYHVAQGLKFEAEHAATYTDPATGKARQFDVRASIVSERRKIALAIECKSLKPTFPLLVSCVPRSATEAYHEILEASSAMGAGASHTRVLPLHRQTHPSAYPRNQGVGKSMRQVKRESGQWSLRPH